MCKKHCRPGHIWPILLNDKNHSVKKTLQARAYLANSAKLEKSLGKKNTADQGIFGQFC
jgi:hypothetical protein